jgi:ABC-2 type transport system ATP-binding protein
MSTGKQNSQEIAIKVDGVSKAFKLPHEKHTTIKSAVLNSFRRKDYEKQEALKDISFEVKKGEFFGIVGRNGSGKSTLLKCMAGVYTPDTGEIKINGTLVPFIELGVGFNAELSGRDNVFLNGALLGFSRDQMLKMYDDIVEFAELEQFMDQKLKNYSSGMQVRLAFSIAIRAKGDILLLDEVLAVGDEAFQRKCFDYFIELKNQNKTVILVTHGMGNITRFCDRAMFLNEGIAESIGGTENITQSYQEANLKTLMTEKAQKVSINDEINSISVEVKCTNPTGELTNNFIDEKYLRFSITISSRLEINDAFLGFSIHKPGGGTLFLATTEKPHPELMTIQKGKLTKIKMKVQNIFPDDTYSIGISVKSKDRNRTYLSAKNVNSFRIINKTKSTNLFNPDCEITIDKDK